MPANAVTFLKNSLDHSVKEPDFPKTNLTLSLPVNSTFEAAPA
jgi:hypothetical protein